MRQGFGSAVIIVGLLIGAVQAHGWAGGGTHGSGGSGGSGGTGQYNWTEKTGVPEPSTLYALGSGLALLGGAGWYIRRRK